MKNSSDTIENQTRYLPACSAVPRLTAPPLGWRSPRIVDPLHSVETSGQLTSPATFLPEKDPALQIDWRRLGGPQLRF